MTAITELDRIERAAMWQRFDDESDAIADVHEGWDNRKAPRGNRRRLKRKNRTASRGVTFPACSCDREICGHHVGCEGSQGRQYQDRRDRQAAAEQIREWEKE